MLLLLMLIPLLLLLMMPPLLRLLLLGLYHTASYITFGGGMYHTTCIILAELHADLFSRHASPLEGYALAAVDERGEDVMSDTICRRCNGKQQRRSGGDRIVHLPDWVMNNIKNNILL